MPYCWAAHDEVLDELRLLDPDLLLLGDRVEQELGLAGALRVLSSTSARCSSSSRRSSPSRWLVHLGLDDAVGDRDLDGLEQVLEHLVAGLDALLEPLGLLGLLR